MIKDSRTHDVTHEKRFLDLLGSFSSCGTPRLELLKLYRKALPWKSLKHWMNTKAQGKIKKEVTLAEADKIKAILFYYVDLLIEDEVKTCKMQ